MFVSISDIIVLMYCFNNAIFFKIKLNIFGEAYDPFNNMLDERNKKITSNLKKKGF